MNRRVFTKKGLLAGVGLSVAPSMGLFNKIDETLLDTITKEEIRVFFGKLLYTRKEVDDYFENKAFLYTIHNSELGWLNNDSYIRNGVNKSITVYNYKKPDGERLMSNYANKPCRINSYGDGIAQGHQVSDFETWQEVLAANFQEPIKNFGIGGYSVYQSYLRMLKEEKHTPSDYIVFYIYNDGHFRSLDAWRNIRFHKQNNFISPPLPFIKVDLKHRSITEHPNPTPNREDFYKLCNFEETYELFNDDFVSKILIANSKSEDLNKNINYEDIQSLMEIQGIKTTLDPKANISTVVNAYYRECALLGTEKIIGKIENFASLKNKKVLYVLSYPAGYLAIAHEKNLRWDTKIIDFLKTKNLPFVDLDQLHLDEFRQYNTSLNEYLKKYFIGHYNPLGNMFCAQAINSRLLELMEPKPKPYNKDTEL